jgi:hypothetical protein
MASQHAWTLTVKPSGLPALPADAASTITGDFSVDIDETVLAGATTQVFSGSINHTQIISYVLHSTQVSTTINTNSSNGAGGQTFALNADKAQGWNNTTMPGITNPVTTDITGIWVVNAATKDTVFRGSFLVSIP